MKNRVWISILILGLIFILTGSFEVFEFENPKVNHWISATGFFLQVIYFTRIFLYKNYFQWNKRGAYIRINSFVEKTLKFDEIKKTELNEKTFTITKVNGKKISFDLSEIAESDTQKLHKVVVSNIIVNSI